MESLSRAFPLAQKALGSAAVDSKVASNTTGEVTRDIADKAIPEMDETSSAHLFTAAKVAVVVAGVGMVAAPSLVALPVLGAVGFGALGPIAGSFAAASQSAIGSVVAPSVFATLQSAAMGGYGATAVFGAVQAVGGAVAAASGASLAWSGLNSREPNPDGKEEKAENEETKIDETAEHNPGSSHELSAKL